MAKKIVITKIQLNHTDLLLCGLMDGSRLIEVRLDRFPGSVRPHPVGSIYIGKVQRVVKNLNAAFVEISPGVPCYLSLERVRDPVMVKSHSPGKIVQDDEIVVQVSRDAVRSKAPAVTTNLNFSGRYAVLTTENRKFGVSSKLDNAARERYKKLLRDAVPAGCGLIVRTNALNASDEDLLGEIRMLAGQMRHITTHAANMTCFSCLYRPEPLYLSYLKGAYTKDLSEIVTDLDSVFDELSAYRRQYRDLAMIPLRRYQDAQLSLAGLCNLNRELMRATEREVRLRSGGFLLIEPTETMTVIDVNTGKSDSPKDPESHFLQINLEAAREIALQLRLRNLSGIILVDFIDLAGAAQQRELLEAFRSCVKPDPVPVLVHDITALNLVEVTRKKVEKSLSEQIKQLTISKPL